MVKPITVDTSGGAHRQTSTLLGLVLFGGVVYDIRFIAHASRR